jgi:cysteine-rich repeat protein
MVVLLGAIAGCIQPSLVMCSDGLACPVSDRCDEIHHACVSPDQLAVCREAIAGEDCAAGPISGGCFDGVCLPRGCGNRVTEPGEMCDDGNQRSGDGCTGDCRSTEICGNGVVDPGELCDDDNLISRDGCDSRCTLEQAAWSDTIAITPSYLDDHGGAYDPVRGRLVYVSSRGTWEWDGQQWTATPHEYLNSEPDAEPSSVGADVRGYDDVFYDPDRQRIAAIARDRAGAVHVYSWIKPHWVQFDHGPGGPIVEDDRVPGRISVAYDVAGHRLILVSAGTSDTSRVWAVDATGAWSDLPPLPGTPNELTGSYDVASGHLVLESESGVEWIFDGSGWSSAETPFSPTVSIVLDPARGRLVLVDNRSQVMYERIGADWQQVDAQVPCGGGEFSGRPPLYYDPFSATIVRFSGNTSQICSWDGSWSQRVPQVPLNPVGATFDPLTRELVIFSSVSHDDENVDTPIEMWRWTEARWRQIETSHVPTGRLEPLVVYSTGRAASVIYNEPPYNCRAPCEAAGTWSVTGGDWTRIAPLPTTEEYYARAMTYDPANRRVLLVALDAVWSLGDAEHDWVRLDATPPTGWISGASWHARHDNLIALGRFENATSSLFELRDEGWAAVGLIPASISTYDNAMGSSERSGGTIMIDRFTGTAWEYVDATWIALPRAPAATLSSAWVVYDPVDGRMFLAGKAEDGFVASVLERISATPLESCHAGEDVDRDGLAGCDDLDCYWACARCPPHTTCL